MGLNIEEKERRKGSVFSYVHQARKIYNNYIYVEESVILSMLTENIW